MTKDDLYILMELLRHFKDDGIYNDYVNEQAERLYDLIGLMVANGDYENEKPKKDN